MNRYREINQKRITSQFFEYVSIGMRNLCCNRELKSLRSLRCGDICLPILHRSLALLIRKEFLIIARLWMRPLATIAQHLIPMRSIDRYRRYASTTAGIDFARRKRSANRIDGSQRATNRHIPTVVKMHNESGQNALCLSNGRHSRGASRHARTARSRPRAVGRTRK